STDRKHRTENNGPKTPDRKRRAKTERARFARPISLSGRLTRSVLLGPSFSVRPSRSVVFGPLFSVRTFRSVLFGPSSFVLSRSSLSLRCIGLQILFRPTACCRRARRLLSASP